MSRRADEVRREIEQTQAELGSKLEEIGDRVSPKKVVARAKEEVSEKVHDVRERVSPTGRLRSGVQRVRQSMTRTDDGDGAAATKRVRGRADQLSGQASRVATAARQAPQKANETAQGNPLAAGLVAFGAGLVAASVLPPSDREHQMVQTAKERIEPLKQQAAEVGKQVAGELKEGAQARVEQVKGRATEAVEKVKDEGQSRVQRATGRAKGAAKELKSQAKSGSGQVQRRTAAATGKVPGESQRATRSVKATTSPKALSAR